MEQTLPIDGRTPLEGGLPGDANFNASEQEVDNRFWDYVIGAALVVTAVILAIYAAPILITVAVFAIGVAFIIEGEPDENGARRSIAAQIWDSTQTLTQNMTNAFDWLANAFKGPWLWLILLALALWYFKNKDDDRSVSIQLSDKLKEVFRSK